MFFTNIIFAQDYSDYLVDKNNTITLCKIIQIKNGKVKYKLQGKSYTTIKYITDFSDVKFNNPDVIKNPLGLKIEKPKPGYSYVYFYYSEIIYKVRYNGQKLTKIGIGSYYRHKIKAGEIHTYSTSGNNLEIAAENQKTYLIRGQIGKFLKNEINRSFGVLSALVIDNRKVSEYALLSMKKKAK